MFLSPHLSLWDLTLTVTHSCTWCQLKLVNITIIHLCTQTCCTINWMFLHVSTWTNEHTTPPVFSSWANTIWHQGSGSSGRLCYREWPPSLSIIMLLYASWVFTSLVQAAFGAKAMTIIDDLIEFRGVSWRYLVSSDSLSLIFYYF